MRYSRKSRGALAKDLECYFAICSADNVELLNVFEYGRGNSVWGFRRPHGGCSTEGPENGEV